MAHSPTRTLIMMSLNEIDGVRDIVPRLPTHAFDELVAVDGGSTDGTIEYLRSRNVRVIVQEERGRGSAFRIGAQNSTGENLVFFSPDGNENPNDIPRLFEELEKGADIVIASRFMKESRNEEDDSWLPLRKWANMGFTLIINVLWNKGPYITDSLNGFRSMSRATFNKLATVSVGFTIEYELCIHAMKKRMRFFEFPTIEGDRIGGETKLASFRTGFRFLAFLARELVSCNA